MDLKLPDRKRECIFSCSCTDCKLLEEPNPKHATWVSRKWLPGEKLDAGLTIMVDLVGIPDLETAQKANSLGNLYGLNVSGIMDHARKAYLIYLDEKNEIIEKDVDNILKGLATV